MKNFFVIILAILFISCTIYNPEGQGQIVVGITWSYGVPADFPALKDQGGPGAGQDLPMVGGDRSKDKMGNRAMVSKVPVILIHGNGANACSNQWGWQTMANFLEAAGYNKAEIWAVSYLGANNSSADMNDPHRNNIEDVRIFIDAVIEYLGVQRVVLIGHSLGAGMVRSYMLGLEKNGSFNAAKTRYNKIAALITVAGGNYGLGTNSTSEFKSGSSFEIDTHKPLGISGFNGYDDTPYGASSTAEMEGVNPNLPLSRNWNGGKFRASTSADNGSNRIFYAGLTATGDFVDSQLANTGYLQGADLNLGWNLGASLTGHEKIIKDQNVFNQGIKPILDKANQFYGPNKPVISFSPDGGSYINGENVNVSISATNNPSAIKYKINSGSYQNYSGPINISTTTTLTAYAINSYGAGDEKSAVFTFTNGPVPVVTISPNGGTFTNSIVVTITATEGGAIEYNTGSGWLNYTGPITLNTTTTLQAKATNSNGTSEIKTATFTKQQPYESATGTLSEHQQAGRTVWDTWPGQAPNGYFYLMNKYGVNTIFTMYRESGSSTWSDIEPNGTVQIPVVTISPNGGTFTSPQTISISATNNPTSIEYKIGNGNWTNYTQTFVINESTTVYARATNSAGTGNAQATFTINSGSGPTTVTFDNNSSNDGYIKATSTGGSPSVGTLSNLAIGCGSDGKHSRAILHFDTSSIPDNVIITRAYIVVKYASGSGSPFSAGNIMIDIKNGYFGSSSTVQTDDWNASATAGDIGTISSFSSGTKQSSDFTSNGLSAINKTGITQIRLRLPTSLSSNNYLFITEGSEAKLYVEYTN